MKQYILSKSKMNPNWYAIIALFIISGFCFQQSFAQTPARFYWKTLSGATDPEKYDHWKKALQWESAFQMQHLHDFLAAIE